jgi:hypothetical protein
MIGEKGENATAPAETPGPSRFRDHHPWVAGARSM